MRPVKVPEAKMPLEIPQDIRREMDHGRPITEAARMAYYEARKYRPEMTKAKNR